MKNVTREQLKKCIFMLSDDFYDVVKKVFGEDYKAEFWMDGMMIGNEDDTLDNKEICEKLSEYFDCHVTSVHCDDCEEVGVWIVYKEALKNIPD